METSTATIAAQSLSEAAALLAQHPDLPQPYITSRSDGTLDLDWMLHLHGRDEAEQKAMAARIVADIDGQWQKGQGDWSGPLALFSQRRGQLQLLVQVRRDAVCERVVVGTETVTIPAVEAQPARTEEREVVEWRCQPLLADAATDATDDETPAVA